MISSQRMTPIPPLSIEITNTSHCLQFMSHLAVIGEICRRYLLLLSRLVQFFILSFSELKRAFYSLFYNTYYIANLKPQITILKSCGQLCRVNATCLPVLDETNPRRVIRSHYAYPRSSDVKTTITTFLLCTKIFLSDVIVLQSTPANKMPLVPCPSMLDTSTSIYISFKFDQVQYHRVHLTRI